AERAPPSIKVHCECSSAEHTNRSSHGAEAYKLLSGQVYQLFHVQFPSSLFSADF
ncbi:unnamed protein product, partial [Musa acuminata var. zebrina]